MNPYFADTRPEAEAVLFDLLRQTPPWRKVQMMEQLNQQMRAVSLAGIRARHPTADAAEIQRHLAEILLGPTLAERVCAALPDGLPLTNPIDATENTGAMMNEATAITLQVVHLLEELQIPYVIGGSLASTFHGVARTTLDAGIVAAVDYTHVPVLMAQLQPEFYISTDALLDAIEHHGSFNLIHLATLFKVDIFIPRTRPFNAAQLANGVNGWLSADAEQPVRITSTEDTILVKLEWYRLGNALSTRQWQDSIGVMRVQGERLDLDYLQRAARDLGIDDLLQEALQQADLLPPPAPIAAP